MIVLWGARHGDVQYGSRAFWRRNIPIDPEVKVLTVGSNYTDVNNYIDIVLIGQTGEPDVATGTVVGIEGAHIGVVL